MIGPIEPLPCPNSPLRSLDPRWKLAALVPAAAIITSFHGLLPTSAALCGALLLAWLGRLPRRWCLAHLGATALLLAPFLIVLPLVHRGGPTWEVGPAILALDGFLAALLLIVKAFAVVLLLLVLLTSAPLPDTFKAAQALHVPGVLVQLGLLTYRYVFVLAGELTRLRVALRVRGYRNRATRHSYRTVGHVAGMLLVRGYERAERVSQAMRCRGFDGRFRSLAEFRTRPVDVLFFLLTTGTATALFTWGSMTR